MNSRGAARMMLARDIMVRRVRTVKPEDRVYDAVKLMIRHNISGVPVVDDGGNLVGMLSHKDCIRALMRAVMEHTPSSRVQDVMSTTLTFVPPETHVLTLAHMYLYQGLRRIPVVEGTKVVGLVCRSDLLRHAVQVWENAPTRDQAILYLSALPDTIPPS